MSDLLADMWGEMQLAGAAGSEADLTRWIGRDGMQVGSGLGPVLFCPATPLRMVLTAIHEGLEDTAIEAWVHDNPRLTAFRRGDLAIAGGALLPELHASWLASGGPKPHPLAPVLRAYAKRPRSLATATVTAARGMVRRAETIGRIERIPWQDAGSVQAAIVDGEPMAATMPDLSGVFGHRPRMRHVYRPAIQAVLKLPGTRELPRDPLLIALEGLPGALSGDVLQFLRIAWAADHPMMATASEGAAVLARTRDGGFRAPRASDLARFARVTEELHGLLLRDPAGTGQWLPLASVEPRILADGSWSVTIGPPAWRADVLRAKSGERWTLTADGGLAARARLIAGADGSPAGRVVSGIEYRLAAEFDGRPGIAPKLRPEHPGGPGPLVFLPWRDVLAMGGIAWDPSDPKAEHAAMHQWRRVRERLAGSGYVAASLRGEAPAGDSVEVVRFAHGGRGRQSGVHVRTSARFVEAARLASLRDGRGFGQVRVPDWLGLTAE